MLLTGDPMLFT